MNGGHHTHMHDRPTGTAGYTIHWAARYDALFNWLLRPSEPIVLELAPVRPGDRVLDVGCGPGSLTVAAGARAGAAGGAYGIDAAPEMVDFARRKAARAGVDVGFQLGVVEAIPFADDTFDVVLSRLVMHHLPGDLKRRGLAEMRRVLKPGGRFLAVDFAPPTHPVGRALVSLMLGHRQRMMESDNRGLVPLLEAAGFAGVEVGPTGYPLLSFVRGTAEKP